jgi:hypothetical protein
MSIELKKNLLDLCLKQIDDKIDILQKEFNVYKDSAANETKSTAGDKHDTSKSMMQMEQEKMSAQLMDILNQKKVLLTVSLNMDQKSIGLGSLVYTNNGIFFLSIFSKPITLDQCVYIPISLQSPIGKELLKSKKDYSFTLNSKQYTVLKFI